MIIKGFFVYWWRWRESNPRPKALNARIYMLSSPFDLVPRQVRWAKRTAEPAWLIWP